MPSHLPYVSSRPVTPWDTTPTPVAQPSTRPQAAHMEMADPRLTRRPAGGPGHASPPRTSLPHRAGGGDARMRDPFAAAPTPTYAAPPPAAGWQTQGPAWGHAGAGAWPAPPAHRPSSPYGPTHQAAANLEYHSDQMFRHDQQRLAYMLLQRTHANGPGDTAYLQAAQAFHASQSHAHQRAAWHQMGQIFRPSLASYTAPGALFNPGWLAQAATLPGVRQALNAAVDSIYRLFRR
jgi:hypothetical protein